MFFPERIQSIRPGDRVLEIGPGSTPHPRSDAFLELAYEAEAERLAQRGGTTPEPDLRGKPIHRYDGGRFPFDDRAFDYVICSHVIEHVPDPLGFVAELNRVSGGRGYIEYPLLPYEYLYDFDVHLHFVRFDRASGTLRFMPKSEAGTQRFSPVGAFFRRTLEQGWDELSACNREVFFEGFEFLSPLVAAPTDRLEDLMPPLSMIRRKSRLRWLLGSVLRRVGL